MPKTITEWVEDSWLSPLFDPDIPTEMKKEALAIALEQYGASEYARGRNNAFVEIERQIPQKRSEKQLTKRGALAASNLEVRGWNDCIEQVAYNLAMTREAARTPKENTDGV